MATAGEIHVKIALQKEITERAKARMLRAGEATVSMRRKYQAQVAEFISEEITFRQEQETLRNLQMSLNTIGYDQKGRILIGTLA